jgi:hypothetical protein
MWVDIRDIRFPLIYYCEPGVTVSLFPVHDFASINKMEEIASANRAEGERARERGLKYLHLKDFERAIKFLNLSHRLRPSPDTLQIR